jgi:hypothetical protein
MPAKSRFTRLDAFTKTVEDARIRTTSGGIVTIVSLLVVLYLIWGEWLDYRRVEVHPELIVDRGRGIANRDLGRLLAPPPPCPPHHHHLRARKRKEKEWPADKNVLLLLPPVART